MNPKSNTPLLAHRVLRVLCVSAALGLVSVAGSASAQDSGSNAQKPFIMILMDTSGSMEWTDEGDGFYPSNTNGSWDPKMEFFNGSATPPNTPGPPAQTYYGPCRTWAPECNSYTRPTWRSEDGGAWLDSNYEETGVEDMRGTNASADERLRNESQPRHVTLKEILTGDMLLAPTDNTKPLTSLDPAVYGPGCWIVPRQRGTGTNGDICAGGSSAFEDFPDHTDAQPHFQEVFDTQLPNGLMDTMSRSAIFGLAMFDGYKDSKKQANGSTNAINKNWKGGKYGKKHIDDQMTRDSNFAGLTEGEGGDDENYNLGVFQMLAPKTFDMGSDVASDVSTFIQYALVDAGYLRDNEDREIVITGSGSVGDPVVVGGDKIVFNNNLTSFLEPHQLGKQPVARATPLAAAIYDLHQYFAEGSAQDSDDGTHSGPVMTDRYRECRPKQVIMLTDGTPDPERGGGDVPMDKETLVSAFGYDKAKYPYSNTEDAIDFFVRDQKYSSSPNSEGVLEFTGSARTSPEQSYLTGSWGDSPGSNDYYKAVNFNPRVHVVGLTGQNDPTAATPDPTIAQEEYQVIRKMAEMAVSGRTCASYYLGDDYIPSAVYGGSCDTETQICLDPRQGDYMRNERGITYDYLATDTTKVECDFPALILSFPTNPPTSDPSNPVQKSDIVKRTAAGLQLLLNHIVSTGLKSRTRPTYVNRLDDSAYLKGGQFRYFSGYSIEPGSVFWKGQLFRQAHLCDSSAPIQTVDFSAEVNALAGKVEWNQDIRTEITTDKRRIFTTFSAWNPDYFINQPDTTTYPGTTSDSRFSLGVGLATLGSYSTRDTFGAGYLKPAPSGHMGWRVPVDHEDFDDIDAKISDIEVTYNDYFHTATENDAKYLVDELRGRTLEKQGRALGAIENASPIAVEPPDRALPIDSYREFQSLYANRPSMVYVATSDGFLHALYAGGIETASSDNIDKVESKSDGPVTKNEQREAWAYLPQMLHKKVAGYLGKRAYLLDGTPTVKDVRLCQPLTNSDAADYNENTLACPTASDLNDAGLQGYLGAYQWRTVLVQGLGSAGEGYFAMDITRPGGQIPDGSVVAPDPIPLWEFDPMWEHYQVATIADNEDDSLVYPDSTSLSQTIKDDCGLGSTDGDEKFWNQSFMGKSVGEAAIGTVVVDGKFGVADTVTRERLRRPIAVFSGGAADQDPGKCREHRMGKAIYVVDMQTGSLLRRFVTYEDNGSTERFDKPVTGTPALYDSRPGSLVTRGFVGDAGGRLFRIDLSNPDPSEWYVQLFFDPLDNASGVGLPPGAKLGPAAFKPALVKSTRTLDNDLLIFYGLGEVGDLSVSGTKQLMIGVRETIEPVTAGTDYRAKATATKLWHHEFDEIANDGTGFNEKLTGAPVVFNSGVYFTTYVEPGADACAPGWSRIYGLKFEGDMDPSDPSLDLSAIDPKGLFVKASTAPEDVERGQAKVPTGTVCYPSNDDCMAYEPSTEAISKLNESIVVRGLAITQGQTCNPDVGVDQMLDPGRSGAGSSSQPTLMAQSTSSSFSGGSSADAVGGSGAAGSGSNDGIFAIEQEIAKTTTGYNPLSWSVIDN